MPRGPPVPAGAEGERRSAVRDVAPEAGLCIVDKCRRWLLIEREQAIRLSLRNAGKCHKIRVFRRQKSIRRACKEASFTRTESELHEGWNERTL